MTIPITPGPWSFLQTLGEGVQAYARNREGKRIQDTKEADEHKNMAWDRLQFLFKGIKDGDISPNVVKSPLFESLVTQSGIGDSFKPQDVTPGPRSQLNVEQGKAVSETLPTLSPTGRRQLAATGQLPTASQEATEGAEAQAQTIRGNVLAGGLTPEQKALVAGVPSATTAQAGAQGKQDPVLGESAYRVVADIFRKTGKIPSPQEAYNYGRSQDVRAMAFGAQLNEPYYGAAIQRLMDEQEELRIKHESAAARSAAQLDVVKQNITPQMQVLQDRIDGRANEVKNLQSQLTVMAKYGQPTEYDQTILAQIAALESQNTTDQANLEAYRRQGAQVIAPRVSAAQGAPEGDIAKRRLEWDRRAKAIRDNPEDPRVKGKTVEQLIGARP